MADFHLAIPIHNIPQARHFYETVLACTLGRMSDRWIDVNFWGHQVSLHLVDTMVVEEPTNSVDSDDVPVRHFGLILDWDEWNALSERLTNGVHADEIAWIIAPKIRFQGEVGEQATMFFRDPSGNALEFKSFQDLSQVFAT
jgi:uncharacterized protein